MRFDWYQATIPENPVVLVDTIKARLGDGGDVEEGRGRHNYHQSFTVRDRAGDRVATVLCGGPNGHPNVAASGDATERFVRLVRDFWPVHRVTRFDAAEDFVQEGSYDRLEAVCRAVGRDRKVKGRAIVPDDISDGRTYYLGSPSSDVRVRLYDKTAETRRSLPAERHSEVPESWTRLEAQIRPRTPEWKGYAAQCSAEEAWSFSGWTRDLGERALGLNLNRVSMRIEREADDERTLRALALQYGAFMRRVQADYGSWDAFGRTVMDILERHEGLARGAAMPGRAAERDSME